MLWKNKALDWAISQQQSFSCLPVGVRDDVVSNTLGSVFPAGLPVTLLLAPDASANGYKTTGGSTGTLPSSIQCVGQHSTTTVQHGISTAAKVLDSATQSQTSKWLRMDSCLLSISICKWGFQVSTSSPILGVNLPHLLPKSTTVSPISLRVKGPIYSHSGLLPNSSLFPGLPHGLPTSWPEFVTYQDTLWLDMTHPVSISHKLILITKEKPYSSELVFSRCWKLATPGYIQRSLLTRS